MHYYEVAPTQVIRPQSSAFTYSYSNELAIGQIVSVPVGKKTLVGVVIKKVEKPSYDTKDIFEVIEDTPLPEELVHLGHWLADYYMTHFALVLQTLLPRGLQKQRRHREKNEKESVRSRTNFLLNKDQLQAVQEVEAASSGTALLHGVTGSGKTAVYIEVAKRSIADGKSVIVLVPEIALTSQIVDEFSAHFENVILTHSKQTEAERHLSWKDALTSKTPRVVIGPRSALFLPLKSVGLIIIDEAHEPSFKQEQSPRYSALRAASILTKAHEAKLILGSATPLITDFYNAIEAGRPIITLPRTARDANPPVVSVVDMTNRGNFTRHRFFSDKLIAEIEASLAQGKQALVFHNRRGSASVTLCEHCGWQSQCPRCFVPLTLHADTHDLRCHICAHTETVPTSCPVCHHADIIFKGIGTKLIESELTKLFPKASIGRFDGDSDALSSVDARYQELYSGSIDIIIGTQVVAKGLDLPQLRTVGVVQADAGLSLPDYSSSERTFQLLAQVVGRVGRGDNETSVVVQSYQPSHPAVDYGLKQDYKSFYDLVIAERKRAKFPPFVFLLKLTCIYKSEPTAIRNAQILAKKLRSVLPNSVEVLGPTPAFYERQRDTYRWQLVLKSKRRADLMGVLEHLPPTHWQFELDPISLI